MQQSQPQSATARKGKATRKDWIGLCVLSLACLVYSMDLSILFLATPAIVADLAPSPTQLLWISDIYGFMVAGFLITMGTLGDRLGRRRVLVWGAAAFAAASVFAALASSAPLLILARGLLGVAGATIAPSTLSLIVNMFEDEEERERAIGVWGAAFSIGGLIGPVVAGLLLSAFHWGAVFLINVPVMLGLIAIAPRFLPEYKSPDAGRLDLISVALSLGAILPFIYGLKVIAAYGFSWQAYAAIPFGLVIAVAFLRRQRMLDNPVIDFQLFRLPRFNVAMLVNLASIFFIFPMFMYQNQYLQLVLGYSALETGLLAVIPSTAFVVMSIYAWQVSGRFGAEAAVIGGLVIFAMACALMGAGAKTGSAAILLAAGAVMALGAMPVILTVTSLIVAAAPAERAGSASAMSETSSELGGAMGIAVLGSFATFLYRNAAAAIDIPALPETAAVAARTTMAAAADEAAKRGIIDAPWLSQAQEAYANSVALTGLVAALCLLALALLAWRVFKGPERQEEDASPN